MTPLYFIVIADVNYFATLVKETEQGLTLITSAGLEVSSLNNKFYCDHLGSYVYKTSQPTIFVKKVLQNEFVYIQQKLEEQYQVVLNMISEKLNPTERHQFERLLDEIHQNAYSAGCHETDFSNAI